MRLPVRTMMSKLSVITVGGQIYIDARLCTKCAVLVFGMVLAFVHLALTHFFKNFDRAVSSTYYNA